METLSLDVRHTFYRTLSSNNSTPGYQTTIDSVYFSVPNRIFAEYGTLQRIKAEWYEFQTKDIIVTSSDYIFEHLTPKIGVLISTNNVDNSIGLKLVENRRVMSGAPPSATWVWNCGGGFVGSPELCNCLYYVFKTDSIQSYDPKISVSDNGGVASSVLTDYIYAYQGVNPLRIKDGVSVSADLFESDIQENRKRNENGNIVQYGGNGKSIYDFDASVDLQSWQSWGDTEHSFFDNVERWGFWNALFGNVCNETGNTITPIKVLEVSDLTGDISETLYINNADESNLRDYYNNARDNQSKVVLFRFATSDYYSQILEYSDTSFLSTFHNNEVYRAKETVFLDFDIIQLTFMKNGTYWVIPCVSNPIDIINAITPPYVLETPDLLSLLLALILIILIIVVLSPFLPFIIKVVVVIIKIPFKVIGFILRPIFKSKKKLRL